MTQVNSPFLLKKIRPREQFTPEKNNYFDQSERIIEQLYRRSGGTTDNQDDLISLSLLYGRIAELERLVGSGDALTFDTDSFTWDSDKFTFDMDEA